MDVSASDLIRGIQGSVQNSAKPEYSVSCMTCLRTVYRQGKPVQ